MRDGLRAVLVDLDGTLSDSRPGIAGSFRFMLGQLGLDPDTVGDLTWAVGPPIRVSIERILARYGDARVDEGLTIYRARYSDVGIYDCSVYDGVVGMLEQLAADGLALRVATSKRRDFADRVIDHLGLRRFFPAVYGALPGGGLDDKHDLIAHILGTEGLAAAETTMIGDRYHDIHAAQKNAVRSVGVLWGYGGHAELDSAGADAIAEVPVQVPGLC